MGKSAWKRRAARKVAGWPGVWAAAAVLPGWYLGAGLKAVVGGPDGFMGAGGLSHGPAGPEAGITAESAGLVLLLASGVFWLAALGAGSAGRHRARSGLVLILAALALGGVSAGWRGSGPGAVRIGAQAGQGGSVFALLRIEDAGLGLSGTGFEGTVWACSGPGGWTAEESPVPVQGWWVPATPGIWLVRAGLEVPGPGSPSGRAVLTLKGAFRLDKGARPLSLASRLAARRRNLAATWVEVLGPDTGTLAGRVLLGPSLPLAPAWSEPFRRTGTLHLLAISGLHLGLLGGLAWLLARILFRGARWSRWAALGLLSLFTLAIGAPTSSRRALGMAWLVSIGPVWGRGSRLWNAWGWMGALLPLLDPTLPDGASFPLSLSATAGVLLGARLGSARRRSVRKPGPRASITRAVLDLGGACLGALILTAPWSWYHFGVVYPLGLAANLLAVPLMAWVLICLIPAVLAVGLGAGTGHPFVALGQSAAEGLLSGLRLASQWTGRWPLGLDLDRTGALAVSLAVGFILWQICRVRVSGQGHATRPRAAGMGRRLVPSVCLPAGIALSLVLALQGSFPPAARIDLRFLDVGQGDAIILRLPGANWMVDCGIGDRRAERRLLDSLLRHRLSRLDRVWLTHGDLDHWGGVAGLLRSPIRVDTLVLPGEAPFPLEFWMTLAAAPQRPVVMRQGAPWSRTLDSGVEVCLLHPAAGLRLESDNNRSFVLHLRRKRAPDRLGFSFLLVGDLEREGERLILDQAGIPRVEILQLGHHGSRTSGDPGWWSAAEPLAAVVSSGSRNRFGFPHRETLESARANQAVLYRTDLDGDVSIRLHRDRIEVRRDLSEEGQGRVDPGWTSPVAD